MFIDVKYSRKGRVIKKEGLKMQCNVSGKSMYSGVAFKMKYLVLSPGEGHGTGPRHPVVQQVLREMILPTTNWDWTQEGFRIWTWYEIIGKIKNWYQDAEFFINLIRVDKVLLITRL